jgi:protein-tyrosine phosphatase
MAEALLRRRLGRSGIAVSVSSAGFLTEGRAPTAEAVQTMATFGLDTSGHVSRRVSRELISRADLVVGMERAHVREVAVLEPSAWPRTFTLKEIVRRGEAVGVRPSGENLSPWIQRVHEGRDPAALTGSAEIDDVADPIGQPLAVYETQAREIEALTQELVDLLWSNEVDERTG